MAGVVDQDVDSAEALLHGLGQRGDTLLARDVRRDGVQRRVLPAGRAGVRPGAPRAEPVLGRCRRRRR